MQHLSTALEEIGMSPKESSVYLVLLQIGQAQIGTLARRCSLSRSTVYDLLQSMTLRGFVYTTQINNKTWYIPIEPQHLHQSIHTKAERFFELLPQFNELMTASPSISQTSYIDNIDGIIQLYETELLESKDCIRTFLGHPVMDDKIKDYYHHIYTPARVSKQIYNRIIATTSPGDERFWGTNEKTLTQTRLLDHPLVDFASQIDLFGDNKVASIHYESTHLTAVLIQSESLYKTLESLFEWIWHKA